MIAKPVVCGSISKLVTKRKESRQRIIVATPIQMATELPGVGSASEIPKETEAIARPSNANQKMVRQSLVIQSQILPGKTLLCAHGVSTFNSSLHSPAAAAF